jgi:serine/threonine protein kinase/Tfp pilus assembly protein PilF
MKTATSVCGRCGAEISDDATPGVCPACLLETGLALLTDESVTGIVDSGGDNGVRAPDRKKATPPAKMLGDFGDYELLEEIGRGGQGVVYRAHQKSLNRTVALKLIGLGLWATEAHLKRFRREAEAAASLNHPFIVPIHEVGERDGCCYFSMNFIEGGQLDEVVRHRPMSIRQAAELVAKVARTVHYAHEHGILHRDIKPGNILLDKNGEPHLTDFGLARLLDAQSSVTRTIDVLGTPSYMAPEQAAGETTKLGKATDVYGLGAVLYQLLTGQPPFAGGTTYETIRLLRDTDPRPPRLINPKVDRDHSTICLKCLEKDPQRRYSSALALAEDLEHWLKHEPIQARRTGIFTRGKKWVRRNPSSALFAASLIALAAAAGWIVWRTEFIRHPLPKSIAVLPLLNKSDDPNDEYFSDGLSEELIAALVQIRELKVIGRSSSFRFKDRKEDSKTIGEKLGVSTLLEGTVRKQGDRVHIVADMVNAADGIELWTRTFDRDLKDIHAVQEEIARAVAESLKLTLLGSDSVQKSAPENVEAHNAYLLGHFYFQRRNLEDDRKAVTYFDEAIRLNPDYALAYAERSEAWFFIGDESSEEKKEAWAAAGSDAERAVAIDPGLAEAHAALGWVRFLVEWKFAEGLSALKRAKELSPRNPTANNLLARVIVYLGRFEEAERLARQAVELDPLSVRAQNTLACVLFFAGKLDEADAIERKMTELQPTAAGNRHWQVLVALQRRDGEAALRLANLESDDANRRFELAIAQYVRGDHKAADAALADLIANDRDQMAYQIALVYAVRGEKNKAFEWLQVSFDNHDAGTLGLFADPLLRGLRADPRYKNLLAKLGLPGAS